MDKIVLSKEKELIPLYGKAKGNLKKAPILIEKRQLKLSIK